MKLLLSSISLLLALVLSACETAIRDRDAELGFAGLAVNVGLSQL